MCGECYKEVITCQEANFNESTKCGLRYLYCLRPYGSPPSNVPLLPQAPLTLTDNFTFEEVLFIVGTQDNIWNRSNPFIRELQLWPVNMCLQVWLIA